MFGANNTVRFGEVGHQPVILLAGTGYILRSGNSRWSRLRDPERALVVYIKPSTFSRRYGELAERLPARIRAATRPLGLSSAPGRPFQPHSHSSRRHCEEAAEKALKGVLIDFQVKKAQKERENGIFHLGRHTYSAGPGYSWSCDYKIERLNPEGTLWEIYATDEETDEYQSMGAHGLAEAQEYFNGVQFYISQEDWLAMGARVDIEELRPSCEVRQED